MPRDDTEPPDAGEVARPRLTVLQGGRRKAYRPLADEERAAAFSAGLIAYREGQFFEAHERWEPAWMGTADIPERELLQGLIKLAAAHVHRERGNALGMAKNLRGARARLAAALDAGADPLGLDVRRLVAAIDNRLARLAADPPPDLETVAPIALRRTHAGGH